MGSPHFLIEEKLWASVHSLGLEENKSKPAVKFVLSFRTMQLHCAERAINASAFLD